MKKSLLFLAILLSAAVFADGSELNYAYREVANQAQSGEYGTLSRGVNHFLGDCPHLQCAANICYNSLMPPLRS